MVQIYIDIHQNGSYEQQITCSEGANLYRVLTDAKLTLSRAVCRGSGVCRGCQVYIVEEGMECLACQYTVMHDIHIRIHETAEACSILLSQADISEPKQQLKPDSPLGLAVDIGTTTIASSLVELEHGTLLAQAGCMNRQAAHGADVISRIQYTVAHATDNPSGILRMHQELIQDIDSLIKHYETLGYSRSRIKRISYSGNTTMLHFLMEQPVSGMAGYPFTPEFLDSRRYEENGIEHLVLPGKSAFVGADIVAGVQYLKLGQTETYELLIDLGTNGELFLLNHTRGVCTSASCGPAFANSVKKGTIYGTTLLEHLADAVTKGLITKDGVIKEPYFETGIPCGEYVITQEAVREIQLAKAAIRTGIELAAYELRLPLSEIRTIYLAGGFGFYLNLESAYVLGLLPEEFRDKVEIVGNTSLEGAIQALLHPQHMLTLPDNVRQSTVLDLSMSKNFQEFFLHRISF